MMKFSVPPGYVRKKPPAKPKLDAFVPMIDRILGDDKSRPKKQQHTAKRIFERLRVSTGRGISSLWGVQFSPLGGLAISRFLDQRLRFSAVDHDA